MEGNSISQIQRALRIAEIIQALEGKATLAQIYASYDYLYPEHRSSYKDWKSLIRRAIYQYSSDADIFLQDMDLFYSSDKGSGKWGIRDFIDQGPRASYLTEEQQFPEGQEMYRLHKSFECNGAAVQSKKQQAMIRGKLKCEVCHFDFSERYGELGEGYIECHHIIPVSDYKKVGKIVTTLDDLILVCSNCHRMLHRKRPWVGKENLSALLIDNEGKPKSPKEYGTRPVVSKSNR